MFCPRCQTNNPDTARFCQNCGLALARNCSNCQSELPAGARFCMDCGQPVLVPTPADSDRLSRLTAVAPGTLVQKMRSGFEGRSNTPAWLAGGKAHSHHTACRRGGLHCPG